MFQTTNQMMMDERWFMMDHNHDQNGKIHEKCPMAHCWTRDEHTLQRVVLQTATWRFPTIGLPPTFGNPHRDNYRDIIPMIIPIIIPIKMQSSSFVSDFP